MIVKNSADTLGVTLKYLDQNFEKVVIVYDDSVDNTEEILMKYKNRFFIVKNDFINFSQQWDKCIRLAHNENVKSDYLLKIDADEIYSETDFDKMATMMQTYNLKGLYFPRYNLQNDYQHYNKKGYPDYQIRLVHESVKMNGKPVDEGFIVKGKMLPFDKCSIIHFGHLRDKQSLIQKSIDRQIFADVDACDGLNMKKYKHWFLERNELWKNDVDVLPEKLQEIVRGYIGI